jgi:hypothetical protein
MSVPRHLHLIQEAYIPGVKTQGPETDHSHVLCTEIKNACSSTSTSPLNLYLHGLLLHWEQVHIYFTFFKCSKFCVSCKYSRRAHYIFYQVNSMFVFLPACSCLYVNIQKKYICFYPFVSDGLFIFREICIYYSGMFYYFLPTLSTLSFYFL